MTINCENFFLDYAEFIQFDFSQKFNKMLNMFKMFCERNSNSEKLLSKKRGRKKITSKILAEESVALSGTKNNAKIKYERNKTVDKNKEKNNELNLLKNEGKTITLSKRKKQLPTIVLKSKKTPDNLSNNKNKKQIYTKIGNFD